MLCELLSSILNRKVTRGISDSESVGLSKLSPPPDPSLGCGAASDRSTVNRPALCAVVVTGISNGGPIGSCRLDSPSNNQKKASKICNGTVVTFPININTEPYCFNPTTKRMLIMVSSVSI